MFSCSDHRTGAGFASLLYSRSPGVLILNSQMLNSARVKSAIHCRMIQTLHEKSLRALRHATRHAAPHGARCPASRIKHNRRDRLRSERPQISPAWCGSGPSLWSPSALPWQSTSSASRCQLPMNVQLLQRSACVLSWSTDGASCQHLVLIRVTVKRVVSMRMGSQVRRDNVPVMSAGSVRRGVPRDQCSSGSHEGQ